MGYVKSWSRHLLTSCSENHLMSFTFGILFTISFFWKTIVCEARSYGSFLLATHIIICFTLRRQYISSVLVHIMII